MGNKRKFQEYDEDKLCRALREICTNYLPLQQVSRKYDKFIPRTTLLRLRDLNLQSLRKWIQQRYLLVKK